MRRRMPTNKAPVPSTPRPTVVGSGTAERLVTVTLMAWPELPPSKLHPVTLPKLKGPNGTKGALTEAPPTKLAQVKVAVARPLALSSKVIVKKEAGAVVAVAVRFNEMAPLKLLVRGVPKIKSPPNELSVPEIILVAGV